MGDRSRWPVDGTVKKKMKTLISGVARVGVARIPGWGPRNSPTAKCQGQWHPCMRNLISYGYLFNLLLRSRSVLVPITVTILPAV